MRSKVAMPASGHSAPPRIYARFAPAHDNDIEKPTTVPTKAPATANTWFCPMEEFLTVKEIAAKLKVSPWTIRTWCSQKYIPYFKLRGAVQFRENEVEQWLKKNVSLGRSLHRPRIESAQLSRCKSL
ncbi:MAG: Helix-turn-helix domain protein [Candidatus Omnitrophica bacterium ADurb.Bin277]|nr:MAG: Helix-turn-helix domain protein [Candidatus Omnitrophica bacterium ADurb.Bin277]